MTAESLPEGLGPDTLAAYMDGALGPEEHARVEALLAGSPAAQEILAEALRLRDDLTRTEAGRRGGAREEDGAVVHRSRSWNRRIGTLVPLAAAAGLVILLTGHPGGQLAVPPVTLVQTASLELEGDWAARPWTEYRGGEEILAAGEAAFRSGVLWTGFVASWTVGASEAGMQATQLIRLLEFGTLNSASVGLTRMLRDQAGSGVSVDEAHSSIQQADRLLRASLLQPWYDWGRVLETVRLAAGTGEQDFLTSKPVRDAVARLDTDGFTDGQRAAVTSLRGELAARPLDLEALQSALGIAFVELGG